MPIRARCVLPALALLLAGCGSGSLSPGGQTDRSDAAPPLNARSEILAFMRTYLNDPTGVQGAQLSEPELRPIGGVNLYSACVRYNARRSDGRYAGSKDSLVLFRAGRFDRLIDNGREQCKDRAYQPFPELERLTR